MTINDLKEGDFLVKNDWIFILAEMSPFENGSYVIVYHALWDGNYILVTETRPGIGFTEYNCKNIRYATNFQRKEFCEKLRKLRALKWDEANNKLVSIYE